MGGRACAHRLRRADGRRSRRTRCGARARHSLRRLVSTWTPRRGWRNSGKVSAKGNVLSRLCAANRAKRARRRRHPHSRLRIAKRRDGADHRDRAPRRAALPDRGSGATAASERSSPLAQTPCERHAQRRWAARKRLSGYLRQSSGVSARAPGGWKLVISDGRLTGWEPDLAAMIKGNR